MSTLESFKNVWKENQPANMAMNNLDEKTMKSIIRSRTKKQLIAPMQYFWGAFVLQMILYAILVHITIRFWPAMNIVLPALFAILLYIPFTLMLLSRFRKLAAIQPILQADADISLKDFVSRQYETISDFFRFKKSYEIFLIPISTAVGSYLFFEIYLPGGVMRYWNEAIFVFLITLLTSVLAILYENRKKFRKPLEDLRLILEDFKQEG
jgi:hypothetical protein